MIVVWIIIEIYYNIYPKMLTLRVFGHSLKYDMCLLVMRIFG